jgi:hypothetical protein
MSVNAPYHIVSLYRRLSYKSYVKKLIWGKAVTVQTHLKIEVFFKDEFRPDSVPAGVA